MTRGDLQDRPKRQPQTLQILADYYQTGDTRDRDLWREYKRATAVLRPCAGHGAVGR